LSQRRGMERVLFPLLTRSSIVIVLLPLNARCGAAWGYPETSLLNQFGCPQKIITRLHTLRRIRAGIFTHVLVSPEIACSLRFYENVLSDARFRRQTKAIVIDEVHLVIDWGQSFRKSYRLLKHFRNRLGCKPWFGCTATLDPSSFNQLCKYTGFKRTVHITRTSVDRPFLHD